MGESLAEARKFATENRGMVMACAVVSGLVLLLALAALVPGPDNAGDRVVVLGDSITGFGESPLADELGETYELTIDGDFGARIGDRVDAAVAHGAGVPDQVVVNLGTNDVVVGTPLDVAGAAMDDVLDALSAVPCVHVVTVGENLVSDGVALPRQGEAINREIADAVARHPNAELLHWDRLQQATAIRRSDPGALTFDGIHPDGEGLATLAEAYADVLADCGRPWLLP